MACRVVVSAAKQVAKGAARPRRRRALRAPLNITPAAAEQVKEILSSNEEALGVRLGVKTRESFLLCCCCSCCARMVISLALFFSFSASFPTLPHAHFPPSALSLSTRYFSFSHCPHTYTYTHTHTHTHLTLCSFPLLSSCFQF